METDHALSQEDIDALFQSQSSAGVSAANAQARAYDFRRSDRIPKEQIRALRAVHDTFTRSLASSLSAYLRTYVSVNLISVEQLSFREFCNCLPSPTCATTLRMEPFEGTAVLEINPSLAFPLIEILLGGGKVRPIVVEREMTSIEQNILDSLLVLILQNLALAWQSVATVHFSVETHETEPAMLQVLAPNEAIVVIAIEIQTGETSGMMNIGIPSNVVKLLRQKFEQQVVRRQTLSEDESGRIAALISGSQVQLEAQMVGPTMRFEQLLDLSVGDIVQFEMPIKAPVELLVNGVSKYNGRIMISDRKKAVCIDHGRQ
jgi:flagellar motor switch protein FliM